MGRPLKFDRDVAMDAALNLIWKKGYGEASVMDLAAAMGITRSSFYNSFGDRETLLREVLQRYRAGSPDSRLWQLQPGDPVLKIITDVFRTICQTCANDPDHRGCVMVNSISELVNTDPVLGPEMKAALEGAADGYEGLLKQAVAQGEMSEPEDLRALAMSVLSFQIGLTVMSKVFPDEHVLWAFVRQFLVNAGLYAE